ncbi:MAG: flagellar hook-associated protein FlgL, partial [Lachnospiraceae bacterium]|nr:flagellar hook-associated protein FlgL [Lachnospiraceae bacterium]
MAMRITTKMMHNTSLRNLNINKLRQEKLTNQMSTGKKITRPSDDPVIAIRSLKLNSSLDKIDQYYEKNASDAQSWLELTESALSTVNDILTNDIRKNIIGAKSSYKTVEDREAVITHLRKAMEEIYATGNSDSGGRSIFTGYRTDMPLTLTAAKKEYNRITEQFLNDTIDKMTFVYAGDIGTINEGNFKDVDDISKKEITSNEIYRKRLAYGNLDLKQVMDPATGKPVEPIEYESNIDIGYMSDAKFDGDGVKIATTSVSSYVTIDTSEIPNEAVFTLTVADDADSPYTVRIPKGKDSTMTDPSIVIEDKNG